MKFARLFTTPNTSVQTQIKWKRVDALIRGKGGKIIYEQKDIEVPETWSQNAANILAQKYFRKAGVPNRTTNVPEEGIPWWLHRRVSYDRAEFIREESAHLVFARLSGCWTYWGWKEGLFDSEADAQTFHDEIYFMLATQKAAPNSPQWFNTGLHWAYGIEGPDSGQWIMDWVPFPKQITTSYVRPQPHACFIQPISDDLVNPGGIMDLWVREARLFKHGSGTGTNFSTLRAKGEHLSGGGVSSGLMSFLKIGDAAAGAIQSGGTTRRAAKMVVLDMDHPEVEEFIGWKAKEERKARAIAIGTEQLALFDHGPIYDNSWEGEAINTVGGQNSNNSIRPKDEFFTAIDNNAIWELKGRTDSSVNRYVPARDLWNSVCAAAWASGDPGIQFADTINAWHTCPNDGPINASNPCSEYVFLDNTACNLASLNLVNFIDSEGSFDVKVFTHATNLWTVVLEISVYMASFPSREIALGSFNYRTLGLGYANAGGLLMRSGIAYDSDLGRNYLAAITALMTGVSYETSAKMASALGPFPRFEANQGPMRAVLDKHVQAVNAIPGNTLYQHILTESYEAWTNIVSAPGFRNAQTTLIAPTGTISFVMDCDTTGIEPDLGLVKYKNLAGGGTIPIANEAVEPALRRMGFTPAQIKTALAYIAEHGSLDGIPNINGRAFLTDDQLAVFDCANQSKAGGRFIRPMAHVEMVAAVQPFLSGAVSKTVNMPPEATVSDVDQVYRTAHRLGVKAITIYRDGSKTTQPLSILKAKDKPTETFEPSPVNIKIEKDETDADTSPLELQRGQRRHLPSRRGGFTEKTVIDGHSIYLRTGEYTDGTLGEIWINLSREGSTVRSVTECFAKAVSLGLQYGVPVQEFVEAFIFTKFEPAGLVQGSDTIKMSSSIVDLVFRTVGISYLGREDLANDKSALSISTGISIPISSGSSTILTEINVKTAETCPECGGLVVRTGTCTECRNCTYSSGGCG